MYAWQHSIVDSTGLIQFNSQVQVLDADTLVPVEIFADENGEIEIDNPFTAADGFARFYAPAGRYQVVATNDEAQRVWENVLLGFTLAEMPDLTATVTPIVTSVIGDAVAELQALLDAIPTKVIFSVLSDGTDMDAPDNISTSRSSEGVYNVDFVSTGFTNYSAQLTVWDPSSDRVYKAMMLEQDDFGFTYVVRSIHDAASNSDSRVEVEITYLGEQGLFPYRYVAIRVDGRWNHSQDGITWSNGGFIEGVSTARDWMNACFNVALNRIYVATSGNRIAYMDGTGTWTTFVSTAPSNTGFEHVIWTPMFGGANGRMYINYRQSGGTRGGLLYSDDGGLNWAEVTYSGGKPATNFDIEYLFLTPTSVVIGGRSGTDTNTQKHFFTTSDGLTFASSIGPITTDINVSDGLMRGGAYSPSHDEIFIFGISQSNFTLPRFFTMNATATAVVTALTNLPTNNSADSFSAIATPTAILGGFNGGVNGTGNSIVRKTGGSSFTGHVPNGVQPMQFAYSPSLGRVVAATNASAFQYSDDEGATWISAAAQGSTTSWRAIIATS